MIALTATATKETRDTIFEILMMNNPKVIRESVNKENVAYTVEYLAKDADLDHYFGWLADELTVKKEQCDRTIVYCQTIKQCSLIYSTLKGMLGYKSENSKNALIEMLHSCTPPSNKEHILSSFSENNGTIRVLVATIAFGMGVDCKGVTRVIHFGPSKNMESYTQETGRAGRDGTQSVAFLLYNGIMLRHVSADMKAYIKNDQCRRTTLLRHFEDNLSDNPKELLHLCCDHCAKICHCGLPECGKLTSFPTTENGNQARSMQRSRDITKHQRTLIHNKLTIYYKTLLMELLSTSANTDVKTLTAIPFLLGFSETQIQQVLENLEHLFTLKDICTIVEIWDMKHAHKILSILNEEFHDIEDSVNSENGDLEFNDMFLDEWEMVLEDDELFELAVDNLSVSQLQDSCTEQETSELNASDVGIPAAVLQTLERVHIGNQ